MAPPGPLRRLAAASYDGLLLLALLMLPTAALQFATGGAAITPASRGAWAYLYRLLMGAVVAGYFGYAWTHGGRTLGMQAWGLALETAAGTAPGWRAAAARLALSAPLHLLAIGATLLLVSHRGGWAAGVAGGAGLLVAYASPPGRARVTLVDRWSGTRIVRRPARGRR